MGEKAEGDIGGLPRSDVVTNCTLPDDEVGDKMGLGSKRRPGFLVDSIAGVWCLVFVVVFPVLCCCIVGMQPRVSREEAMVLRPFGHSRCQVRYPSCAANSRLGLKSYEWAAQPSTQMRVSKSFFIESCARR